MKEKIYSIHDEWDGLILKGTADFNGEKFYFSNIFDKILDDFSEVYELTKLNQYIFNLEVENWEYWIFWLSSLKQYNGFEEQAKYIANGCVGHPHPVNYADFRKTQSFAEIEKKCIFSNKDNLNKAEKYYQNKLIIEQYLKNNKPLIFAKGVFFRNEVDPKVIWTIIE